MQASASASRTAAAQGEARAEVVDNMRRAMLPTSIPTSLRAKLREIAARPDAGGTLADLCESVLTTFIAEAPWVKKRANFEWLETRDPKSMTGDTSIYRLFNAQVSADTNAAVRRLCQELRTPAGRRVSVAAFVYTALQRFADTVEAPPPLPATARAKAVSFTLSERQARRLARALKIEGSATLALAELVDAIIFRVNELA